ncbi:hypothetical protein, partial [Corallococcus sp. CA047B]|uniref:hypothetical protein n=1 Tax=Corallococcus sp. CA047B TaxID=2316729 RepID=UPI001F2FA74C
DDAEDLASWPEEGGGGGGLSREGAACGSRALDGREAAATFTSPADVEGSTSVACEDPDDPVSR